MFDMDGGNYPTTDDNVIFVEENVPGPEENSDEYNLILDHFNSQLTQQCDCSHGCKPNSCPCIKLSGGCNYVMDNYTNKLVLDPNIIVNSSITKPILECNDLCSCNVNCGNRLVQKGALESLYVRKCFNGNKGRGLFNRKFISQGTFICEYAGEVITKTQVLSRHKYNLKYDKMNYIFCLNEHSDSKITQTFVDPSCIGNIGRYANHSCDPNCVVLPVRVNTPVPKLAIFSCRNINKDNEITFQYGYQPPENQIGCKQRKCLCGSSNCTGWMPYEVYSEES